MSFGFGVGDFLVTIELALKIYEKYYKVARGAPKEFQCLIQEIGILHHSLDLLRKEANNKESILVRAGDERMKMAEKVVRQVDITLQKLEKHSKKYENLSKIHSSSIKKWWTGVKWSAEASDLDALRNKIVYHNGVISLLLISCANSSIQRVEAIALGVEKGVNDIKNMIRGPGDAAPTLSAIEDDKTFTISLSRNLMKSAEINGRRWSAIGVDEWIQAGSWWLLKSQMDLYTGPRLKCKISSQGYANLLKAAWILIDIITKHPQLDYLETNTGYGVKLLVETIRRELENVTNSGLVRPTVTALSTSDLAIWETQVKEPTLQPHLETMNSGLSRQAWMTENEYVLFQRFVYYQTNSYSIEMPCIVLFLMHKSIKEAKIVLRDQSWFTLATFLVRDETPCPVENIVQIGDQKIRFSTTQDVLHLCAISEAAMEYLFYCNFNENDLETMQAFTLLFSVKNNYRELVERLLEDEEVYLEIDRPRETIREKYSTRLRRVANDLASQPTETHKPVQGGPPNAEIYLSLFLWCVKHGYNKIAIMVGEGKGVHMDEQSVVMCKSLHHAVRSGNSEFVKLVSSEKDVNLEARGDSTDGLGYTALQISAKTGFKAAIDILIEAGADLTADSSQSLCYAVENGHLAAVRRLLEVGGDAKVVGSKALCNAFDKGRLDLVECLIKAGADGVKVLRQAARNSHLDTVNRLLDPGADAKADDSPALSQAAERGHLDMVNRLLDAGANAKAYDSRALSNAAERGHLDVVNRLLDAGVDAKAARWALSHAAERGHLDVVNRLLDAGADAKAYDSRALSNAAERGHLDMVNRLLDAGADAKADNSWALSNAAEGGHLDVVNRLLDAGVDAKVDYSWALKGAASGGHLDVVNRLLDAGANAKAYDSRALSNAAERGHLDMVNRLLDAGADAKADDSMALGNAAEGGHLSVVNRLLDAGADAKADNSWALSNAAEGGHLDVVNRLLDAGADAKADDSMALSNAAKGGHLDVVKRLLDAGADAKADDSMALSNAAKGGHLDVVNRLLDAGADIKHLDSGVRTKLETWKSKYQSTLRPDHIPLKPTTPTS